MYHAGDASNSGRRKKKNNNNTNKTEEEQQEEARINHEQNEQLRLAYLSSPAFAQDQKKYEKNNALDDAMANKNRRNKKGNWTRQEEDQLIDLNIRHKNKWTTIGRIVGRHGDPCRKKMGGKIMQKRKRKREEEIDLASNSKKK